LKDKGLYKALGVISLVLFAVSAVLIRSWALYLSIGLSFFLLIFLYARTRKLRLTCLILYLSFIAVFFHLPFVQNALIKQVAEDVRPYIWSGVFNLIQHHPVMGCGAGQFLIFYPTYRNPEYFRHPLSVDSTDHAHCELLEMCSELGIIGLVSFLLFLFFLVRFVIRNTKNRDPSFQIYVYSILTGVFLLMFENLFDVNMRFMSSKFVFWSFLGWFYGLSSQFISDQNKVQHSFSAVQAPDVSSGESFSAVQAVFTASGSAKRSPLTTFQKSVGVLLIIFILSFGFAIPFLSDYYFRKGVKERIDGRYDNAVKFYRKSVMIWPKHIEAQYRLGYLYGSLGLSEKAAQAYLEVIKMAPFFASIHGNLGAVYSQMDDLEAAYRHLSIQERLNPYDADRLCSLASVLIRMGKIEEAKKFLRRALLLNPNHEFALTALKQLWYQNTIDHAEPPSDDHLT